MDDRISGALDDNPKDSEGDEEGEKPFSDGTGVCIDLERGPAKHVLVLGRRELHDRQNTPGRAKSLFCKMNQVHKPLASR